jgi:hypothetical protein
MKDPPYVFASVREKRSAPVMGKTAMAIPAVTFAIDPPNRGLVAADTVVLQDTLSAFRDPDRLRDCSRVEDHHVLHPVYALPEIVREYVLVGQMTVYATNFAVRPLVEPGLVLGLHDMA